MQKTKSAKTPLRPQSQRLVLEPRIVFDAVLPVMGAEAIDHLVQHSTVDTSYSVEAPATADNHIDESNHAAAADRALIDGTLAPTNLAATEIIFIDAIVADLQQYITDHPNADVVLLDSTKDALGQISAVLNGRTDISAIHILSHGSSGELQIGNGVLNLQNLTSGSHATDLAIIKSAMAEDGDILIYGCDVGAGANGQAFIDALAANTGADIAASTDTTGSSDLGGDWVLELSTGNIETAVVLDIKAQAEYKGVLVAINIVANTNPIVTAGGGPGIIGTTARYQNVAVIGANNIDFRATVISTAAGDTNDTMTFARTGTQPAITLNGGANGSTVTVRWELLIAGTNTPISADFSIAVNDLDGPILTEAVSASTQFGLTSYTVETGTNLTVTTANNQVTATGTQNENGAPVSAIRFSWTNVSSVDFVYTTGNNVGGRGFNHNGAPASVFTNPITTVLTSIDLDGNDSTATNNNYLNTFTENGTPVRIIDTDMLVNSPPPNFTGGTVTLSNAQAGDVLTIGTLPTGIAATINTSVAGQITVNLTGTATPANYVLALQAVRFNNTSENPNATDRNIQVGLFNGSNFTNTPAATIRVVPVNDAPAGTDKTIAAVEDTAYTLSAADFGFTDPTDLSAHTLLNVIITTLPTTGTLRLAGVAVTAGQVIAAASIPSLTWTPAANASGNAISNFTFQVIDNGGVANGGQNTDQSPNTITFNVATINDAPVNIVPTTQTTLEDTPKVFSTANGNALQISDVDAGGGNVTVTIWAENGLLTLASTAGLTFSTTTNNGSGTDTAVSTGTNDATIRVTGTVAAINAALNGLTFTPTRNTNGNADVGSGTGIGKISIRTEDNGNTGAGGNLSDTDSVIINITAVKDTTVDNVSTNEDTPITISPLSNDSFGAGNVFLTAVTSPNNGTSVVNAGAGTTTYTPNANFNGTDSYTYTTTTIDAGFTYEYFTANQADGATYAATFTSGFPTGAANSTGWTAAISGDDGIRIQEHQNDPDTGLTARWSGVVLIEQAGTYTFSLSADNAARLFIDGSPVVSVGWFDGTLTGTVVGLSAGVHTFQLEYADTAINQRVELSYSGLDTLGATVNVNNDKHWGAAARTETETINITVNPINDEPSGTDKTITINEDATYTVLAADFGFSDANDTPANAFSNVIIGGTLPPAAQGVYQLNGINITPNQVISVADINAGRLTFVPAANVNTTGLATLGALSFQVQDNGATGGLNQNTDQTPNTLNFRITPVDDVVTLSNLSNGTVAGTDAQVREGDLNGFLPGDGGSTEAGTGETATGTFSIGPNSALASTGTAVSINGGVAGQADITKAQLAASVGAPINVVGSNGTLSITGYNTVTGVVTYSYTLTSAADHTGNITVNDSFAITTTDVEGQTATGALAINILDDAPIAANDVDNTINSTGNPSSVAYGNVFNGSNDGDGGNTDPNGQDGVADIIGADKNFSPVTAVKAGTAPGAPVGGIGGAGVTGTYGVLILNDDGSYRYTPTTLGNPAILTDIFTYQITDGDGDTATATITISIVPSPAITGLGDGTVAGTDGSVLESDLAAGTNAAGLGETLVSNFNLFTGLNSLASADALTIGSTTISQAALVAASTTNITVAGTSFGTLTITNYDSATGVVTYSYTLTGAQTHGTPQESVNLTIKDNLGNTGAGTLRIDIQDDAPIAAADTNSVTETGTAGGTSPIAGNVFTTNDQIGADGASTAPVGPVTGVIAGTAGTPGNTGINTGVVGTYGTLTLQANGSYSYALNNANPVVNALKAGQTLTDTYTYKITDSDGDISTTTLTITINGANDAPIAADNTYSMNEDALPITLTPLVGDSDPDGDVLRVSNIAGTAITAGTAYSIPVTNGTVNVSAGGVITFTPAPNFNGTATFAYTISDPSGATAPANQIINVAPVNDAPSPSPDIGNTNEDTPLVVNAATGLLANDTDIDTGTNAGLTITQFTIAGVPGTFTAGTTANIPSVGTLQINANGSYTFTPTANYNGAVPVATYTVTDNGSPAALTATSTLTLSINPTNDAPTLVNDVRTIPEDTTATGNVLTNDSDIDTGNNAGLTVTQFTIAGVVGTFTVPPAGSNTQTIAGVGDITINSNGTYNFVPLPNFNGVVPSITYTANDGTGQPNSTATAQLNITVTPVNDPPVANDDGVLPIVEDAPTTLNLLGNDTDVDGDTLSVKSINGTLLTPGTAQTINVPNGTVNVSATGVITFSPAPNYNGPATFDYVVQDGNGGEDTGTVNLNVTPVNDAPTDANEANTVTEDTILTVANGAPGDLLNNATDADGNPLTITGYTIPGISGTQTVGAPVLITGVGTITINANGSYSFEPAPNFTGAIPVVTYTVSDGSLTDTSTLALTMAAVNDPPVATPTSPSGNEDTPIPVSLAGSDVDGTVVSVTVPVLPSAAEGILYLANGTTPVDANTPLTPAQAAGLIFKPAPNFNGTVVIPFVVTDNNGAVSAPADATITVNPVNDAPVAISGSTNTPEDTDATVNLSGTDIDGTITSITVTALPTAAQGVLYYAGGVTPVSTTIPLTPTEAATLIFRPTLDFNGLVNIPFAVTDNLGAASVVSGNFLIDVADVNDPPVATNVNSTGIEDTVLNVALPGTDVDGSIARVTVTSLPPATQGILYKPDGVTPVVAGAPLTPLEAANLKFAPAPNFTGTVNPFNFTVTDDDNEISTPATVNITIGATNDAPDALPDTNTVAEDSVATGNVLANDSDTENDTLSVTQFTIPGLGTFTAGTTATILNVGTLQINANGTYTFTPVLNYNGIVPVATYTVTDGTLTSTSTLAITVTPVNDAPVPLSSNATANEDTPVTVNLSATDVDGTIASISVVTLPDPAQGVLYYADGVTPVSTSTPLTPAQAAGLRFVPAPNFNGTVTIPFNATDNSSAQSASPGVFTININPVNDLPTATPTTATGAEDTPINIGLVGTDIEDPAAALITRVTTLPPASQGVLRLADGSLVVAGAALTNAQAAGIVFTPAANFNGTVTIPFTVTDTNGGVSTPANAVITVSAVNDNPVAVTDNYTMNEDGAAITLAPLTADSDIDGNPLTVTNINGTTIVAGTAYPSIPVTGGIVSVSATGVISFTPTPNFNGTVTFPYTISDGQGGTATANQVITVNAVNDPPVATPYAVTATEDAVSVNVSLVGTDVEDGTPNIVRVTSLPPASQGVLYLADGTTPVVAGTTLTSAQAASLLFKPATNFNDVVTVPFTVTDSNGTTSAPANAVITITDINDPPVAISASRNTLEDTNVPVNLAATDVDGTVVGITVTQLPAANEGVLYFAGGLIPVVQGVEMTPAQAAGLVFIPALNYNSTASDLVDIRFTARDDDGGISLPASFVIDVAGLNDDPLATPTSATTPEDTPVALTFTGTDVEDGVATSVSFVSLPPATQGVLTLTDGTPVVAGVDYPPGSFIFTPAPNFNGIVNPIQFTVKDSLGQVSSPPVIANISVGVVNDAPVPAPDSQTIAEDTTATGNVLTNDTDVDSPTLTVSTFTIAGEAGPFVVGTPYVIAGVGTLTLSSTGTYTFAPVANYNGSVPQITYTVNDGSGTPTATATSTLNITVTPVNDPPVATPTSVTGNEDAASTPVSLVGTDVDNPSADLTTTVTTLPPVNQGVLTLADGTPVVAGQPLTAAQAAGLIFVPAPNFNGTVNIPFTVRDPSGLVSPSATATITVNAVNDPPVANNGTFAGLEDTPLPFVLTGSDIEGPIVAYNVTVLPDPITQGTVYLADGVTPVTTTTLLTPAQAASLVFVPVNNFFGTAALSFTVTDNEGQPSAPATITLQVNDVVQAPVATPVSITSTPEKPIPISLGGTDADGFVASVTVQSLPPASQGVLTLADGTLVVAGTPLTPSQAAGLIFVPAAGFTGTVQIPFLVTDDEGNNSPVAFASISVVVDSDVLFEQLGTQRNPFGEGLDPNRPDPFAIRSPVIPIGMPEDLFVTNSVRESAMRIAQNSNFGVFNVDTPTRGELDNLTFDLKGLPVGMDPTLYVQHAVRSLPITQEPRLFVQNAVRQSQLESTMRNVGVTSFNSASSGVSSLFSSFDLGSPNDATDLTIDGVNGEFAATAEASTDSSATELALDKNTESVVDLKTLELTAAKDVDAKAISKQLNAKLTQPAEAKKMAAASFANQLNSAAKKFKANDIFNSN